MRETCARTPAARLLGLGAFLTFALMATACSGVQVVSETSDPDALRGIETYSWTSRPAPRDVEGRATYEPDLARDAQQRIDEALQARGWQEVRESRADVLLTEHFFVETIERQQDPYFNYYTSVVEEIGRFALEAIDPETDERVWIGVAESRLRVVSRGVGVDSVNSVASEDERDWKLAEKVEAVLGRLSSGR